MKRKSADTQKEHNIPETNHSTTKECDLSNNSESEPILHIVEKHHLDRAKFNKCLEHLCRDSPFSTPRSCYQEAKKKLRPYIDMKNIPSLKSFESLIYRRQKLDVPLLPRTISEQEKLVHDPKYRKSYSHDSRGNFRGVWKGSTGNNVAFVSETILQATRKLDDLELLMDGTFNVLPRSCARNKK